jgi:hypothetical protein
MNALAKTSGSFSGEPSITARTMLQQTCEKHWTLPRCSDLTSTAGPLPPRIPAWRGIVERTALLIAPGHSILLILYHGLKAGTSYTHLGGDFLDRLEPDCLTRYYVKRLERHGYKVTLEVLAAV